MAASTGASSKRAFATAGVLALAVGISVSAAAAPNRFKQVNLVSDQAGVALQTDPDLINPWGVAFNPGNPFWVADNGTGKSTLYNALGVKQDLVVTIPVPGADPAKPTGQVFNPTPDFKGDLFIFATEQGTIAGWKPADGTTTVTGADRSAAGAIYKGLALGSNAQGNFLYAANFHAGTVDVFDKNYALVTLAGNFTDPKAPAGYAPFNIKNIGGRLYVAFAKQDQNQEDEIQGAGFGFVSIFDTNGKFLKRFVSGTDAGGKLSVLNAPWGIARAPSGFGPFGGDILVGNFGSGHVAAFNSKGKYLGTLRNTSNHTITIDGLWEIVFGKGGTGSSKKLYFTAGPEDETHGLFGSLESTKKKH